MSNAEAQIRQEQDVRPKIERQGRGESPTHTDNQPVKEMNVPPQKRFSRKAIILGAIGSLVVLAGIIGTFALLAGENPASITSVGMVNIPSGGYVIGTNTTVDLADFWIDRYEVTNSNYAKFIKETGIDPPKYWVDGEIPAVETVE